MNARLGWRFRYRKRYADETLANLQLKKSSRSNNTTQIMGEDIPCILSAIIYCSMKLIFHQLLLSKDNTRQREGKTVQVVHNVPLHRLRFIPNGSQISLNYHTTTHAKDSMLHRSAWIYCSQSFIMLPLIHHHLPLTHYDERRKKRFHE